MTNATVLGMQARALAEHVRAFNDLVARDTGTHDGKPRGPDWDEGQWDINSQDLALVGVGLDKLANLWDNG